MGKDTIVEVLPGKNVRLRGRFSQYDDYVPYQLEESNFEEEAANYGRGYGAGWAGMPGDFNEMVGGLVQGGVTALQKAPEVRGLMGYLGAKAHQYAPATTEDVGRHWGADVESPEFKAGTYGLPGLEDAALQGGKGLAALFFHGAPNKWSKPATFDELARHMGTGEGAQAFGWGMYFAENPGVAKSYTTFKTKESFDMASWIKSAGSKDEALKQARKMANNPSLSAAQKKKMHKQIADLENYSEGHLYEVDIPDEITDKMLDWDKPLSEQPESVRKAFGEIAKHPALQGDATIAIRRNLERAGRGEPTNWGRYKVKNLYEDLAEHIVGTGSSEINLASGMYTNQGGEAAASQVLNQAGIPGIRFFDSDSRKAGEGTRNIVVFDPDSAIKQVKRDGELVYEAEPAARGVGLIAKPGKYLGNVSRPVKTRVPHRDPARLDLGGVKPTKETEVLINPTEADLKRWSGREKTEVRFAEDVEGNLYVWPADAALHDQMFETIPNAVPLEGHHSDYIVRADELYDDYRWWWDGKGGDFDRERTPRIIKESLDKEYKATVTNMRRRAR